MDFTELRLNVLRVVLFRFIVFVLIVAAFGLMLESVGLSIAGLLDTASGRWFIGSGLKVFLIVAVTAAVLKLFSMLLDHSFSKFSACYDDELKKRADTLKAVIRNAVYGLLIFVAIIMILDNVGLDIGPLLTTAGVLGVGIGFGAQQLVRDVINGFFILLDNQVRVGDVAGIAGKTGLVERVNLRMIVLRDGSGNVHFIRNGEIRVVTNMTKEYSRYVFEVGVAYREDVDEVIAVLKQIDDEMRQDPVYGPDILEPLEVQGLDRFADSAIIIRARNKTKPRRQWAVGREFNRRMKKKFDELGIEIPFPHRTLYMGQGKDGSAAPVNVRMPSAASS